jgi:hypothetical protein
MPLSIPTTISPATIGILATGRKGSNSQGVPTVSFSGGSITVEQLKKVLVSMDLQKSTTVFPPKGLVAVAFTSITTRDDFYDLFTPHREAIVVQSDGFVRFDVFGTHTQAIECVQNIGGVLSECAFNAHMTITFSEPDAHKFTELLVPNGRSYTVADSGLTTANWQNELHKTALQALEEKRAAEEDQRKAKAIQDAKDKAIALMNHDAQRCKEKRREVELRRGNSGGASATLTTASQKSVVMPSDSKTSLVRASAGHSWGDDENITRLPVPVSKTSTVVQQPLVQSYDDALMANIAAKEQLATLEKDFAEKADALAKETRAISVKIAQMKQKLSRTPENS